MYLNHFFAYSKRSAYYIMGTKIATMVATVYLGLTPANLQAHEILLIIFSIALVQGVTQAIENMIVHARRQDPGKGHEPVSKLSKRAYYRKSKGAQALSFFSPKKGSPPLASTASGTLDVESGSTVNSPIAEELAETKRLPGNQPQHTPPAQEFYI